MLFATPTLSPDDSAVLAAIDQLRGHLRHNLSQTRRWYGTLARQHRARGVRGSNSIEGIEVSEEQALAIEQDDEGLTAVDDTWLAVKGYSDAMTYARVLADDPSRRIDTSTLLAMHFMVQGHDLDQRPGTFRAGDNYVQEEGTGRTVYEGPDAAEAPALVDELLSQIEADLGDVPTLVLGAMAHLNLVMIHPFRDGNGRISRILQSACLYRDRVSEAEFVSVEEYLGRNTRAYYDVLAQTGGGRWEPDRSTRAWVEFMLTAHYCQAITVLRRVEIMSRVAERVDGLVAEFQLPERMVMSLESTLSGWELTNSRYRDDADVTAATATRDLRQLCELGILERRGQKRGSRYLPHASHRQWLDVQRRDLQEQFDPSVDPYRVLRVEGTLDGLGHSSLR